MSTDIKAWTELLSTTIKASRLSGSKTEKIASESKQIPNESTSTAITSFLRLNNSFKNGDKSRISAIYVFDAIARANKGVKGRETFLGMMEGVVESFVGGLVDDGKGGVWQEGKEKAKKMIDIWRKNGTFPADCLARLDQRIKIAATPQSTTPTYPPLSPVGPSMLVEKSTSGSAAPISGGVSSGQGIIETAPGTLPPEIQKLLGIQKPASNSPAPGGLDLTALLAGIKPTLSPNPSIQSPVAGSIPPPKPTLPFDPAQLAALADLAKNAPPIAGPSSFRPPLSGPAPPNLPTPILGGHLGQGSGYESYPPFPPNAGPSNSFDRPPFPGQSRQSGSYGSQEGYGTQGGGGEYGRRSSREGHLSHNRRFSDDRRDFGRPGQNGPSQLGQGYPGHTQGQGQGPGQGQTQGRGQDRQRSRSPRGRFENRPSPIYGQNEERRGQHPDRRNGLNDVYQESGDRNLGNRDRGERDRERGMNRRNQGWENQGREGPQGNQSGDNGWQRRQNSHQQMNSSPSNPHPPSLPTVSRREERSSGRAVLPLLEGKDEFGRDLPANSREKEEEEEDMALDDSDDEGRFGKQQGGKIAQSQSRRDDGTKQHYPNQPTSSYDATANRTSQGQGQGAQPPFRPTPASAKKTLETFDRSSFNPADPNSWSDLAEAWVGSTGNQPNQFELMSFLATGVMGDQNLMGMGGMGGMGGMNTMGSMNTMNPGGIGGAMGMGMGGGMSGMGMKGNMGHGNEQ